MRIVVMGVSGCGKSTVGKQLALELGLGFVEGDSLHSHENVEKMRAEIPLTDEDRWPWLTTIGKHLLMTEGGCIVSCSALRRSYRDLLRRCGGPDVRFVFLDGSFELINERLQQRSNHYMPQSLLQSQFDTLEYPEGEDDLLILSIAEPTEVLTRTAIEWLQDKKPKDNNDE
ncbi:gluconokinase [Rhodobacteraceae bacterium RKSG542]|uniref:gluconokinase n=1 Tax=Pseudovibrio flavus TaxID=2529854 RepID=UPI0012BB4B91|nr:gluconokinase [Pseudovibrio flavus]MTI18578.1 gluconokinase [Pseudovibrio flavus]